MSLRMSLTTLGHSKAALLEMLRRVPFRGLTTRKSKIFHDIAKHYVEGSGFSSSKLLATIRQVPHEALPSVVSQIDEFHLRGLDATKTLAEKAAFNKNQKLLDLGSGLGGPARFLHRQYGCNVLGLDYLVEFVQASREISSLLGDVNLRNWTLESDLNGAPSLWFQQADITKLRQYLNPQLKFDGIWMQHVSMNIRTSEEKKNLWRDINRLLHEKGLFCVYEVFQGESDSLMLLPVPFATSAHDYHLQTPESFLKDMQKMGFHQQYWTDVSGLCIDWIESMRSAPPPTNDINMKLVMGDQKNLAAQKSLNLYKNLKKKRLCVYEGIFQKIDTVNS